MISLEWLSWNRQILDTGTPYQILAFRWQTTPKSAWSGSHDRMMMTQFQFSRPQSYLRNGWSESRQIYVCRWNISMYQWNISSFGWETTL